MKDSKIKEIMTNNTHPKTRSEIKNEINEKFDVNKETKCFNDCWNYLSEIISKGSSKKSDLTKYKFKKFVVYFVLTFVPLAFIAIIFLLVLLLPHLVFNFDYPGAWRLLPLGILLFLTFAVCYPLFILWRKYVVCKQLCKFKLSQIIAFQGKKYLLTFNPETLINLYKDSYFYGVFKQSVGLVDFEIGKNKTCVMCELVNVFNYFIKVQNELTKNFSLLDAYLNTILS